MKAFQNIGLRRQSEQQNPLGDMNDPALGGPGSDEKATSVANETAVKRGSINEFMMEISGRKVFSCKDTPGKKDKKRVEPYQRRREDIAGRDMRFNFPIQPIGYGEDPS
jgi:hypothetical protein